MESICPICKKPYDGVVCSQCTVTDLDVSGLMASEGLQVESAEQKDDAATAFLVDLVSNRKIPITTPRCKVGRDDLNDIVISGDQSISRFHFVITKENNQYLVQDGKSRHGTFLNGNQISDPEPIHDGDVLKVGVSLFWFVIESAANTADTNKGPTSVRAGSDLEFTVPGSDTAIAETDATMALPKVSNADIQNAAAAAESKSDNGKGASTKNGKGKASKGDKAEKNKDFEGETFSADPNSPEQSQSTLLNAISDSIQGANSDSDSAKAEKGKGGQKMDKLRRFDAESLNRDEDYALGNFTFFEPLTGQSSGDDTREPGQLNSSATSEFVPYDASAYEAQEEAAKAEAAKEAALQEQKKSEDSEESKDLSEDLKDSEVAKTEDTEQNADTDSDKSKGEAVETDVTAEKESEETSNKIESESSENAVVSETAETSTTAESTDNEVTASAETAEDSSSEIVAKDDTSAATLDKFAEIVDEASSSAEAKKADEEKEERESLSKVIGEIQPSQADQQNSEASEVSAETAQSNQEENHTNGANGPMSTAIESSGVVPTWCKKYFSSELSDLGKELNELNEQVKAAQQKIQDVQSRVALTRGLRNVLLSSQGEELVEGCSKVLSLLGWEVKVSDDDKHELRLNGGEKDVCIASIVWTNTQADRTHLAQLSISQTRFWCEQGVEPKGILIVSKASDSEPEQLNSSDFTSELAEYAKKKNVCLMTTLQLLSIYKEVALNKGNVDKVREKMAESNGWLDGFALEPGELLEETEEPSAEDKDGVASKSLSSLLSA